MIAIADAEQMRRQTSDKYVGDTVVHHLQNADLLVLNKTDLVDAGELARLREWLTGLAPTVPIMDTHHGHVPTLALSGPLHDAPRDQNDAAEPSSPHPHYESWSFTTETPFARADVETFLTELQAADVLRAKGFVRLVDDLDHSYLVQVVGRRSSLTRHQANHEDRFKTRLMVIGLPGSIDAKRFKRILQGA